MFVEVMLLELIMNQNCISGLANKYKLRIDAHKELLILHETIDWTIACYREP